LSSLLERRASRRLMFGVASTPWKVWPQAIKGTLSGEKRPYLWVDRLGHHHGVQ
jgi:hypothetical protein